jgi:predicted O-methyltransferase YrrM
MVLPKISAYLREIRKLKEKHPENFDVQELIRSLPAWYRSIKSQKSPLIDELPWMTFGAIRFLERSLNKQMRVYEYGVGGSTIFFAKRAGETVSVEHDPEWSRLVIESMTKGGYKNWRIQLAEPGPDDCSRGKDPADPNAYISCDDSFAGRSFRDYASKIDEYAAGYFDLIVIDGRARPSCFKHAMPKVKPGGFLVLDNAERDYYSYIHRSLDSAEWTLHDFYGPGPYNLYFWRTCVWQRTERGG